MMDLSNMMLLAFEGHKDQVDRGGEKYIKHPLAVMEMVRNVFGNDQELLMIALGHDLLEDSHFSMEDLYEHGFSERVVLGILSLTKVDGQSYEEYKEQVKSNQDAMKVKIFDLEHNSDLSRLKKVSDKDLERREKYQQFRKELLEELFK
jgi:(p)ppGpp synthase/HD superfamily hydrolase